jgi:xanthine dehydrogenase accessory factor
MEPLARAAELQAAGRAFVMVTVVAARGSAPRHAGAKLVLEPDGAFCGTVGGGAIEHAVLSRRAEWVALVEPKLVTYDLTRDLGMACGGAVDLLIEPVGARPRLVLYGAGHVAIELTAVAARAGFRVAVVDDRPEWANRDNHPAADEVVVAPLDGSTDGVELTPADYVVVVTRGHRYDFEMASRALRAAPRYLGVIGSRRKAAALRERLATDGHAPDAVAAVRVPVGVDIGSETPPEIAVSVVAELISVRRKGGA